MNKLLKAFMIFMMVFSLYGCVQKEKPMISLQEVTYKDNWKMSKEDQKFFDHGDKYILFVYGKDNKVMGDSYFDKYVGPADYKEGYLYIKDGKEDKLYQLSTTTVDDCFVTNDNRNLVVCDKEIFELSENLDSYVSIYKLHGDVNFNVFDKEEKKDYLYFVDGSDMIKLNLIDYSYDILTDKCYGESFSVKKDIAIYCSIYSENQEGGIDYIINIKDGYRRAVINIEEFKMFDYDDNFFGQETEYTYQKSQELIGTEK